MESVAKGDSYRIAAIVNEDLGRGFSLTGVEILPADNAKRAVELLREAMESSEWGIIIVDEALLAGIDDHERNALLERTIPLVIAVPAAMQWRDTEQATNDDFVARLIRRAVGYQLNIQV